MQLFTLLKIDIDEKENTYRRIYKYSSSNRKLQKENYKIKEKKCFRNAQKKCCPIVTIEIVKRPIIGARNIEEIKTPCL